MSSIIEVSGLRKTYRGAIALDHIDFAIDSPGVYGFLGPNGSGKTTTIRCLLGLVRPSAGSIRVLGADISDLRSVITRIGALVEGPKFVPNTSGRLALELLAAIDRLPQARIHEVLELVELVERADDPVHTYSMGMQQRLGIAAALLRDPELVILDEPANGLDPAGIADIRQLVHRLGDEGRTVFVSSHQLHEVQVMCDRVIIVNHGRVIRDASVKEIVSGATQRRVVVTIDKRDTACAVLEGAGFAALPTMEADQLVVQLADGADASDVTRVLAGKGLYISGLASDAVSLEDAFLALTAPSTKTAPTSDRALTTDVPPDSGFSPKATT